MAEEKETRAVLAAISLAYPGRFRVASEQIAATVELWQGLLSDLPEGAALAACRDLVACKEHPPSISEIRSEALSVTLGKGRPEAGEAWGEVCRAFGSVGRNELPEWSSPAITLAVRAVGGWLHLCNSQNAASDRAKFVDNYTAVLERASKEVLQGRAESVEEALELRLPPAKWGEPKLLGERTFHREVMGKPVPQITTEAEAAELFGKNSRAALDVAAELGKKMKR